MVDTYPGAAAAQRPLELTGANIAFLMFSNSFSITNLTLYWARSFRIRVIAIRNSFQQNEIYQNSDVRS